MGRYVIRQAEGIRGVLHNGVGTFNVLINSDTTSARNFALLCNVCQPGLISELHSHKEEHAMYVLEGRGTLLIDGETHEVEEDSAVFIPPDVPHSFYTLEKKAMRYLVLYAPQGPEKQLIARGKAAFQK